MKNSLLLIVILLITGIHAHAQVAEKLQQLGMENIRTSHTDSKTVVAFEDNVYRGTYRGIGKAIIAALDVLNNGGLEMVVTDNNIPQLCISISQELAAEYKSGKADIREVYRQMGISCDTRQAMEILKSNHKVTNSSFGKVDIVIYPEVKLENSGWDALYTYYVNLAPAVEMPLWKGAELTAQVIFPIATNLNGQYKKIRPGVMTLSQEFYWGKTFTGRLVAGNFTNNRMGVQAEMKWCASNGRVELGAVAGGTIQSIITNNEGWYLSRKKRMNAAVKASVYEPRFNLQFDVQASRYLYGDYGLRGDCTRHFGEYAIGVYGMYVDGELNGGFHFAIPLPGKKWAKNRGVRIRQADYFAMEYSMTTWGKYADRNMGKTYKTRPDENRSNRFFQPDYIRYFLIKESN
ncbi:hypothetical protein [Phocaeicola sp.]